MRTWDVLDEENETMKYLEKYGPKDKGMKGIV